MKMWKFGLIPSLVLLACGASCQQAQPEGSRTSNQNETATADEKRNLEIDRHGNLVTIKSKFRQEVKKVKVGSDGNYFVLVHYGDVDYQNLGFELFETNSHGDQLWSYRPKNLEEDIFDFDLTPEGLPLLIKSYKNSDEKESHFRILVWNDKANPPQEFDLMDSDRDQNYYYNFDKEDVDKREPLPMDPKGRVSFFRFGPLQAQALIRYDSSGIYVSATGYVGEEIFALDWKMNTRWQRKVFPSTFYHSTNLTTQTPYLLINKDRIYTATRMDKEDLDFAKQHLSFSFLWKSGPEVRALIQSWDFNGSEYRYNIVSGQENSYIKGLAPNPSGIGVLMTVGKNGNREGLIQTLGTELSPMDGQVALNIKNETKLFAFVGTPGGGYLVGGSCGTFQVPTNSVVQYGDACLAQIDSRGKVVNQTIFGTERDDYISSLDITKGGEILMGGVINGPITHTADKDQFQAYKWGFYGILSDFRILR